MRAQLPLAMVSLLAVVLAACTGLGATSEREYVAGAPAGVLDSIFSNWDVREARIAEDRYALALRMRVIHSGGNGEARTLFNRRAAQLAHEGGFAGYRILTYTEGVESSPLLAQRVAEGTIQLVGAQR